MKNSSHQTCPTGTSVNSGKGLPEPGSYEGPGNLRSFSLQESNNLEVSQES